MKRLKALSCVSAEQKFLSHLDLPSIHAVDEQDNADDCSCTEGKNPKRLIDAACARACNERRDILSNLSCRLEFSRPSCAERGSDRVRRSAYMFASNFATHSIYL